MSDRRPPSWLPSREEPRAKKASNTAASTAAAATRTTAAPRCVDGRRGGATGWSLPARARGAASSTTVGP